MSFFFNETAPTEIYPLSLHDALPISPAGRGGGPAPAGGPALPPRAHDVPRVRAAHRRPAAGGIDRKSTRLNSSHVRISYAVFCLKKKKKMTRFTWHLLVLVVCLPLVV